VVIPAAAYPTYAVGAAVAGCRVVTAETAADVADERPALVWTNSPSNPTGRVADAAETSDWIAYCRERGALLVADECYGEFGWDAEPVSALDARINGGDVTASWAPTRCRSGRTWPATARASSVATPPSWASCSTCANISG